MLVWIIIGGYIIGFLLIGYFSGRITTKTAEDYFLASRTFGPLLLIFTIMASLYSAWIFLGASGWGFTMGLPWYALLSFPVVINTMFFYLIGVKSWRLAKNSGYITPCELIGGIYDSTTMRVILAIIYLVWIIPYIAVQTMGSGAIFNALSDGAIPNWAGALIGIIIIGIYLTLGGMRGVVWTDLVQGVILLGGLIVAVVGIAIGMGGFSKAMETVAAQDLGPLTMSGRNGFFTRTTFLTFPFLFVGTVMMPHLFQRYFIAKSEQTLKKLVIWFPLIAGIIYLLPLLIGLWGTVHFPELKVPSQALPMMVGKFFPAWFLAIIMAAGLAAMFSTADSQILMLSSFVTRDIYKAVFNKSATAKQETIVGRVLVVIICAASFGLSVKPPQTLVTLGIYAITGVTILLPIVLAALYWPRSTKAGAIAGTVAGEVVYALYLLKIIPPSFLPRGFDPIIIAYAAAILGLVVGTYLSAPRQVNELEKFYGSKARLVSRLRSG